LHQAPALHVGAEENEPLEMALDNCLVIVSFLSRRKLRGRGIIFYQKDGFKGK